MKNPDYHFLVCNSFRVSGMPQGVCNKKAPLICSVTGEEIADRGLNARFARPAA